jgi:outer membrane protein assembly factor BamB
MARVAPAAPFPRPSAVAAVVTAVLLVLAGCGRTPAEWPQYRGPAGLGIADAGNLPTTWSAGGANIRWRTPLPGRGNSSPIVAGDRVFLTAAIDGPGEKGQRQRVVLALDLKTGKVLWQREIFTGPRSHMNKQLNTDAASTPVTDGESVYAYFGSHLSRLTKDGKVVWTKEIDPAYQRYTVYGTASSPILAGRALIVVQDQEQTESPDVGWMAAFDRESGKELWRQQWKNTCCSYATPLLWQRPGAGEELLFAYSGALVAHDPQTGKRLWEHPYPMSLIVSGPVVDREIGDKGDQGNIACELGGAQNNKGNLCVRVTGPSRSAKVEQLWYEPERAPETASAVLYRGRLYAVTQAGVLSCYDPVTGKLHFAEHLENGGGFRAALIAGDGKVYAQPTWGPTAVIDATTDAFRVLAYNDLGEAGNNASPAVGGGCLLLRTAEHLFCIEKEKAAAKAS